MNVSYPNRTQRPRHCGGGGDQQALVKLAQIEAPVEAITERSKIACSILLQVEGMVAIWLAGLEIAQNGVDPLELGTSLGLRPAITVGWWLQPAPVTAAKQANPSENTTLPGATFPFTHATTSSLVNPVTGVRRTRSGRSSSVRETAATNGTLFSAPRPTLPPVRSPPG